MVAVESNRLDLAFGFVAAPVERDDKVNYTYTLPHLLSLFLDEVEDRFGPRDMTFTPVGVVVITTGGPQIWFPGDRDRKRVLIQLNENARLDSDKAFLQLAHETFHLLAPAPGWTIVAEEGLAVIFSEEMAVRFGVDRHDYVPSYKAARDAAAELLAIDEGIVKRIRLAQPSFRLWTPELLIEHGVAQDLAERLCEPFSALAEALADSFTLARSAAARAG